MNANTTIQMRNKHFVGIIMSICAHLCDWHIDHHCCCLWC